MVPRRMGVIVVGFRWCRAEYGFTDIGDRQLPPFQIEA